MNKCEHENIIHIEVSGDYDGVLYKECRDCGWKENRFTGIEFSKSKSRAEFTPIYQFDELGKLVGYSKYRAEGLGLNDDLNEGVNLLWGVRGEDGKGELIFRPIKDLDVAHIKAIIIEGHTRDREYLNAFTDRLSNIITIKPNEQ